MVLDIKNVGSHLFGLNSGKVTMTAFFFSGRIDVATDQ